ncbi:MAG TPA: hypothetical protein VKD65_08590 [Candidatus Angelobacter sp.]|nr:hypothetical protein [Candidatus Angelobacter sp.]
MERLLNGEVFYRNLLRHAYREEWDYRFARAIYWQLPRRPGRCAGAMGWVRASPRWRGTTPARGGGAATAFDPA